MNCHYAAHSVPHYALANQARSNVDFKYGGGGMTLSTPSVPRAYINSDQADSDSNSSGFYYPRVSKSSERVVSPRSSEKRSMDGLLNDWRFLSLLNMLNSSKYGPSECVPSHNHVHNHFATEELFSRKVFVGGLPGDVDEDEIRRTFQRFGRVSVDWPRLPGGQVARDDDFIYNVNRSMTGYVFLVFEDERSVQMLVNQCHKEGDNYYLFFSSPTMRAKPVQVRPWKLSDMNYMLCSSMVLDPRRTVFVGGLPRTTRAYELVLSASGIDVDPEFKYPKGAARVAFATKEGFIAAVNGRFVQITRTDSRKRVEIKPYVMDEQMCDECWGINCMSRYAPYFCGDTSCLQYYCELCWDKMHIGLRAGHRPFVRLGEHTKVLDTPPHQLTYPGRISPQQLEAKPVSRILAFLVNIFVSYMFLLLLFLY